MSIPTKNPSRTGIWSLVLVIAAPALGFAGLLAGIMAFGAGMSGESGAEAWGILMLLLFAVAGAAVIAALVTGIVAVAKNRGRVQGIITLGLFGALILLASVGAAVEATNDVLGF